MFEKLEEKPEDDPFPPPPPDLRTTQKSCLVFRGFSFGISHLTRPSPNHTRTSSSAIHSTQEICMCVCVGERERERAKPEEHCANNAEGGEEVRGLEALSRVWRSSLHLHYLQRETRMGWGEEGRRIWVYTSLPSFAKVLSLSLLLILFSHYSHEAIFGSTRD